MLSVNPLYGTIYYNIAKAALDMVTKQFALELGPYNIRVNTVAPGMTMTKTLLEHPFYKEPNAKILTKTPMGRLNNESDIVDPILYFLSDHSKMVTGTRQLVDGGYLLQIPL